MSTPGIPDPAPSPAPTSPERGTLPPVDPLVSMRLGEFVIEERIGSGGMGVVYRAVHPLIGKQAAVKVLRAELMSPEQEQRLLVEAKAVNAIRHPGILDIFNCGALPDGRPYVVMELLQGRSLEDVLHAQGRLNVGMTVWVLDQLLSALAAAHRTGVVHRDLKPENVFLVEVPDTAPTLKLVDFGIAQVMQAEEPLPSGVKRPSGAKRPMTGTPECMSPEQIRGGPVGPAADLYAVGILAFQMLTGARPFQGEHMQVMFAQVEQSPPAPSTRAEGIAPGLDALVLQLLEKDPARRPASAQAVREQLHQLARELSLEGPKGSILAFTPPTFAVPPPPAVVQPTTRWGRAPIAMAAVVALAFLGMGTGVLTWVREAAPEAKAPAAVEAASGPVVKTPHSAGPLDTWETVLIRSRAPAVLLPAGGPEAPLGPAR